MVAVKGGGVPTALKVLVDGAGGESSGQASGRVKVSLEKENRTFEAEGAHTRIAYSDLGLGS